MNASHDTTGARCSGWNNGSCEGSVYCPPRCPRFVDADREPLLVEPVDDVHRDGLVEMYEAFDTDDRTLGLPPTDPTRLDRWLAHLTTAGPSLVARRDDEVVGHIAGDPTGDGGLELVVFVHPDHRDRGLGTELVRHLVAHADARDYDALTLVVEYGNRRARAVYDHLGFEETHRAGPEIEMRLSFDDPIATAVHRPPAEWPPA